MKFMSIENFTIMKSQSFPSQKSKNCHWVFPLPHFQHKSNQVLLILPPTCFLNLPLFLHFWFHCHHHFLSEHFHSLVIGILCFLSIVTFLFKILKLLISYEVNASSSAWHTSPFLIWSMPTIPPSSLTTPCLCLYIPTIQTVYPVLDTTCSFHPFCLQWHSSPISPAPPHPLSLSSGIISSRKFSLLSSPLPA